mgnify:CR=1 FL=1
MGTIKLPSPFWMEEDWKTAIGFQECPYYFWKELFTKEDCEHIIRNEHKYNLKIAVTGTEQYEMEHGEPVEDLKHLSKAERQLHYRDIRNSEVGWIPYDKASAWIYDRMWESAVNTNKQWNFDIRGFGEAIQYTNYDATEGEEQYYTMHRDNGIPNNHRKLSFTVQLTSSDEYEGGDFELEEAGILPYKDIGDCIMFPSFLKHRILPVTSGCRKSLVVWISGPPLR